MPASGSVSSIPGSGRGSASRLLTAAASGARPRSMAARRRRSAAAMCASSGQRESRQSERGAHSLHAAASEGACRCARAAV
eukprot:6251958-Prymnesium_polylepis.1